MTAIAFWAVGTIDLEKIRSRKPKMYVFNQFEQVLSVGWDCHWDFGLIWLLNVNSSGTHPEYLHICCTFPPKILKSVIFSEVSHFKWKILFTWSYQITNGTSLEYSMKYFDTVNREITRESKTWNDSTIF